MRTPGAVLVGLLAMGSGPAFAGPAATVVMLPLQNLSGAELAREAMGDLVAAALAQKGYSVVRGEPVEKILEAERVRYLDSLPEASRARLFTELGAGFVASGAVYSFADGENPIVALSLRLVREDGTTAWWNVLGLSANETEGMFGLKRASSLQALAKETTLRCLRDLPAPGAEPRPAQKRRGPFGQPQPTTFKGAGLEKGRRYRVCLLPFENFTSAREAPQTLSMLLWRRLAEDGAFEVVEPAELRGAMVAEVVRSFRDMDPEKLRKLGSRFGTDLFVRGTLYSYREASRHGTAVPPEVALELTLVDVREGRVLWTSDHSRSGTQYQTLLQRGAIANVVSLTDQVLSEMVDAEKKSGPPTAARALRTTEARPASTHEKGSTTP